MRRGHGAHGGQGIQCGREERGGQGAMEQRLLKPGAVTTLGQVTLNPRAVTTLGLWVLKPGAGTTLEHF